MAPAVRAAHASPVPLRREDAVQHGLPGVLAEEAPLPSERVLSGELMGARRREAFDGMRRALGDRPEGFTREEFSVAVSLLCPPHLPPGTAGARGSLAYRARECFPGYDGPAAVRAYCEHRDRPHVKALVADMRALEGLDVLAQRGMWREYLGLAGAAVAERLRPPVGMTLQDHVACFEASDLAKLAASMAALTKMAADFDALQAPRMTSLDGEEGTAAAQADVHKALAENLARVQADLAARRGES